MQRITAMEYIRGIAMLGVVAIHTGGYSLVNNPAVDVDLFGWLEIFTRFSIPVFFFISGFGLFIKDTPETEFHYLRFLLRRGRSVLIPYLVWSFLYMAHYAATTGDQGVWSQDKMIELLLFGAASYQLYFLVILVWFYLLMPLWRPLLFKVILPAPWVTMSILFLGQIGFNYYSCYELHPALNDPFWNMALRYRLSWLVVHYLFIFLFGGLFAVRFDVFRSRLDSHRIAVTLFFLGSLGAMFAWYYVELARSGNPEEAVNIVQQLSPVGVVYTLAAALFWFSLFDNRLPRPLAGILDILSTHSYAVYLIHPLALYYAAEYLEINHLLMTPAITGQFFLAVVLISLAAAKLIRETGRILPLLSILLTGCEVPRRKLKAL